MKKLGWNNWCIFGQKTLLLVLLWNDMLCSAGPPEQQWTIFSKATHSTFQDVFFDCSQKHDGYYTLQENDCTIYHECSSANLLTGLKQSSTHVCPTGTRFDIKNHKCVWWDAVECKDDFSPIKQHNQDRKKKKRKVKRMPRKMAFSADKRKWHSSVPQDFMFPPEAYVRPPLYDNNNVGQSCYWCCNPVSTTTTKPTPATTWTPWTPKPTTPSWTLSWRPQYKPEIISAAKNKKWNEDHSSHNTVHDFLSPANEVFLKFKLFTEKPNNNNFEDFVVVDSAAATPSTTEYYDPEVLEARKDIRTYNWWGKPYRKDVV